MSALPAFLLAHSSKVEDLLDSFIAYRKCRPPQTRLLRRREELPWQFRGYVRPGDANCAWRAWAQGTRTSFLVAALAETGLPDRNPPVLDIFFFDADGQPFPRNRWRPRADGSWLECIHSPPERPSRLSLVR
jgi:hypothetical protein